eukprot:1280386-Rhodomonas_salina.1
MKLTESLWFACSCRSLFLSFAPFYFSSSASNLASSTAISRLKQLSSGGSPACHLLQMLHVRLALVDGKLPLPVPPPRPPPLPLRQPPPPPRCDPPCPPRPW